MKKKSKKQDNVEGEAPPATFSLDYFKQQGAIGGRM